MGVFDPGAPIAAPRLRILPIWRARDGEPSHYLVIDRFAVSAADAHEVGARVQNNVNVPVLLFACEVELPDVDDDYRDGDEELIQMRSVDRARYAAGETSCAGGC